MGPSTSRAPPGQGLLLLLDSPCLCLPDGRTHPLRLNPAVLLALLALRGPLPNAWLARLLFPESPQLQAENNLRQRVHQLNKAVGFELVVGGQQRRELSPTVTHELADPVARLRADPQALRGSLLGAERFTDRPDLADAIDTERQNWRERLRAALSQVALEHEAALRIAQALPCALRLVEDDPLSEHAVRLLMRLHHRRGDKGAALDAFERCKAALYDALGDAPTDETVELALAIARHQVPQAAPLPPVPLVLQHPPRTFGRDELLAQAAGLLQAGVVLLTGPAGIGKTRVVDELTQRLDLPVVCRLLPGDATNDLATLGRLAQALGPWLAPAAPGQAPGLDGEYLGLQQWLAGPRLQAPPRTLAPELLVLWLKQALAVAQARGLRAVAIEDLHNADDASLALLVPHWQGASANGIGWLLSSRDTPLPAAVAAWLATAAAQGHPQLALPPLSAAALADWVASLELQAMDPARWAQALHAHCGGHPWSVAQILRTLNQQGQLQAAAPPQQLPVPADLLAQTARALDHGEVRAQQLAFIAALAGPDFSDKLALRLLRCTVTELVVPWRQLESLGVLRGTRFCHDLMRQAVAQAVPAVLAPALHGELAAALTELGAAPATLAMHWENAGEWTLAASECARAARLAMDAGLAQRARAQWLQAASLHTQAGRSAQAFDAGWQAGIHTRSAVSPTAAVAHATQLLAQAVDTRQRAQALCLLAEVRAELHEATALATAREAVALAQELTDPALLAMTRLREVTALRREGQTETALAVLTQLQSEHHLLSARDRQEAQTLQANLLVSAGRFSEAVTQLCGQLAQATARGDRLLAAELAGYTAMPLSALCRLSESLAYAEQGHTLGVAVGYDPALLAVDLLNIAAVSADLGYFQRAVDTAESAAASLRAAGAWGWMISCENLLAEVFVRLGRPDLAEQRLGEPPAEAPEWSKAVRSAAQARLARVRGRSPLPGLKRAAQLLARSGTDYGEAIRIRAALELARWDDPGAAAHQAQAALDWAGRGEHRGLMRYARLVQIEAAQRSGLTAAAGSAAAALRAELGPDPEVDNLYLPELWWTICQAFDQAGQGPGAAAVARQARSWLQGRAESHVPAVFRNSFLERNQFNRELLARADSP